MRWPDVSKVHDEEAEGSWAFYIAEYTTGDRSFVFKLTRSPQNPKVLEVDGLTSSGNGEGLQLILPKLVADAKKLGITGVKWSAADGGFNNRTPMKNGEVRAVGGDNPQRAAAVRDRLFNRLLSQAGLQRVT